jgi:hypothetical protein
MDLTQTQSSIYYPKLDTTNGKYIDECPIPPYNRNKYLEYHCLCNNSKFYNMSEYKKHIKLKSHVRFLDNYLHYISDLEYAKQQAIEYRTLYEITHRKLLEYQKIIDFGKEMENID